MTYAYKGFVCVEHSFAQSPAKPNRMNKTTGNLSLSGYLSFNVALCVYKGQR